MEQALATIDAAFAAAPRPPDAELLHERCFDDNDIAALYGVSQWRELDDATVEREAGLQEFTASKLEALDERQREAAVAFLDAATELGDEHVAAEAGLALTWWRRPGSGR